MHPLLPDLENNDTNGENFSGTIALLPCSAFKVIITNALQPVSNVYTLNYLLPDKHWFLLLRRTSLLKTLWKGEIACDK